MFVSAKPHNKWSNIGLRALVVSLVGIVALSLADGILEGPITYSSLG
jgi:hypothetical protein